MSPASPDGSPSQKPAPTSLSASASIAAPLWPAMLLSMIGVALFSMMDVAMKGAAIGAGAYSALLWRSIGASLLTGGGMLATRNRWPPPPPVLRLHLLRGLVIGCMAWLFFWALTRLPLAEAIALSFIAPIIALMLSALVLGEHVGRQSILAGLLGLAGVGVILSGRLAGHYDGRAVAGAGAILVSAVLFAINLVLQRRQAQLAAPIEIAFFQNAVILLMLAPLAPWLARAAAAAHWREIAAAAALATASQIVLARAYARAPASRLIPIEYSAFIWAALFGWLIFGEALTLAVGAGVMLIIFACLLTARERPQPVTPAEI